MKILKFKSFMAAIVLSAFAFMACEETNNPVTNNPTKPAAPKDLMATSMSASSIRITWTPSTSETSSDFMDYVVTVTPGTFGTQSVVKTANPYLIANLDEGVPYTITLKARSKDSVLSDAATVIWAPARRFTSEFKMYEYLSNNGSGLDIFNGSTPENLTASQKAKWDLVLDTRNDTLVIGAARNTLLSTIGDNNITPTSITEVSTTIFDNVQSLNDVYDSEALSTYANWGYNYINLKSSQIDPQGGIVMFVRTKATAQDDWNYAKVFIKRGSNGSFLQDVGPNRYILMQISYQNEPGVPYARPRS